MPKYIDFRRKPRHHFDLEATLFFEYCRRYVDILAQGRNSLHTMHTIQRVNVGKIVEIQNHVHVLGLPVGCFSWHLRFLRFFRWLKFFEGPPLKTGKIAASQNSTHRRTEEISFVRDANGCQAL